MHAMLRISNNTSKKHNSKEKKKQWNKALHQPKLRINRTLESKDALNHDNARYTARYQLVL